jgi:hypothetical protein
MKPLIQEYEELIVKDLMRTAPDHLEFEQDFSFGQNRLYNVLKAYANLDPEIGYCQGMNFIAAMLLLNIKD